jgi:hypothetical protein
VDSFEDKLAKIAKARRIKKEDYAQAVETIKHFETLGLSNSLCRPMRHARAIVTRVNELAIKHKPKVPSLIRSSAGWTADKGGH